MNYKTVEKELLKRVGYRERQKLCNNNSKEIKQVRDGVYSFRNITFAYKKIGYDDFTIFD